LYTGAEGRISSGAEYAHDIVLLSYSKVWCALDIKGNTTRQANTQSTIYNYGRFGMRRRARPDDRTNDCHPCHHMHLLYYRDRTTKTRLLTACSLISSLSSLDRSTGISLELRIDHVAAGSTSRWTMSSGICPI
jgi:hypothetical protein